MITCIETPPLPDFPFLREESLFSLWSIIRSLKLVSIRGGLGHPKIETRLRGERFESVMGECVIYKFELN